MAIITSNPDNYKGHLESSGLEVVDPGQVLI